MIYHVMSKLGYPLAGAFVLFVVYENTVKPLIARIAQAFGAS